LNQRGLSDCEKGARRRGARADRFQEEATLWIVMLCHGSLLCDPDLYARHRYK
jgi:hypothetical protein